VSQVNREDGLVEDLEGAEATAEPYEAVERLEIMEKSLADAQKQLESLVTMQRALVAHLLPADIVQDLLQLCSPELEEVK
jgi:hypothetical protein